MLRLGKTKITKQEFYGTEEPIKIGHNDVDNIVVSKSIEAKENLTVWSYLDKVIRPLVLIMSRMNGFARTFKENKLISFHIDDERRWKKFKTIWSEIEKLEGFELSTLRVLHD